MYPYGTPFGQSCPDPRFGRTFVPGRGPNPRQPTHVVGPRPEAPRETSRSSAPAQEGGRTTVVRPRETPRYGTRIDQSGTRMGRVINPLCRCQNPNSHGDAWAFTGDALQVRDVHGRRMTWAEHANKAIDHHGRFPISRREELEAYRYVLHPASYACLNYHLQRPRPGRTAREARGHKRQT